MKLMILIPARAGSKGVKNKNSIKIKGHSLVERAIKFVQENFHSYNYQIHISTDCNKVIDQAYELGVKIPYKRPSKIAQDETPMADVVNYAIDHSYKNNYFPDYILLLQPTSPMRTFKNIKLAIDLLENNNSISASCSLTRVSDDCSPFKLVTISNNKVNFIFPENKYTTRQEQPIAYKRDGNFFLFRTSVFITEKSIYGANCVPILTEEHEYCNIDSTDDLDKFLMKV